VPLAREVAAARLRALDASADLLSNGMGRERCLCLA